MSKQPITIRISYDVLKDLLQLPEDVDVLGIVGIDDLGGSFPLIVETPPKHIRGGAMRALYRKDAGNTVFDGFAPDGLKP